MSDKAPEWAERAALRWTGPLGNRSLAGTIAEEFNKSKEARKLEKWPEMVKALRATRPWLRGDDGHSERAAGIIAIVEAALAGEPEEGGA